MAKPLLLNNIFLFIFLLFNKTDVLTHPFYKTMSPENEAGCYAELKKLEDAAIEQLKKTYPNIPASDWDYLKTIEKDVQNYLHSQMALQVPHKEIPPDDPEKEKKELLLKTLYDEMKKLNIKPGCIFVDFASNDEQNKAHPDKIKAKTWYNILPKKPNISSMLFRKQSEYYMDIETYPIIKFYTNYFFRSKGLILTQHDILTIKHELTHITEGHYLKTIYINNLINNYYGEGEIKTQNYKDNIIYFFKAKETIANILPSCTDSKLAQELLTYKAVFFWTGTEIHPDGKTIIKWLHTIKNEEGLPLSTQPFIQWLYKKKALLLLKISYIKNIISR